jgi:hypothetical protein
MNWIIQLRSHHEGERYYTSRGKGVTYEKSKAKVFSTQKEAEDKAKECTLWPDAKATPL